MFSIYTYILKRKRFTKVKQKIILFLAAIFIISAILLAKDFVVRVILEKTINALSGLNIRAGSVDIGIFDTSIRVKNMVILNPSPFPDKVMAEINQLYVNYDFTSGMRREIHIRDMIFDVGLVTVVKNKQGENNLDSLKIVKIMKQTNSCEKNGKAMPRIRIDKLHLKGGKVIYKDYTRSPYPAITEFEVRVDEKYENITNPYELMSLIVSRSLVKTSPSTSIGFDLAPLQNQVNDAMSAIKNTTEQVTKALQLNK